MKIILSKLEIKDMVRKTLNLTEPFDFEISEFNVPDAIMAVVKDIRANLAPDRKIQYIKKMREILPPMGLAEAKYVIENFEAWDKILTQTGRLPVINNLTGGYFSLS